jgi:hypothetical protein
MLEELPQLPSVSATDCSMAAQETMQAVVFHGPYKVAVERRPMPKVRDPQDIVIKVGYTALCGR